MVATLITIRPARFSDAAEIADVHDAAWRDAYRGIIPGRELERMIARRGRTWWENAIRRGSRLMVLDFDESIGGYASYGRNRVPSLPYGGEIFELYLAPEFQGVGFGRRLFNAVRRDLTEFGLATTLVWALADNERALGFYRHMGGALLHQAEERFGSEMRERVAFGFSQS
ncbi:MAG: GNAT family N-acetyltransferase [Hyphomicrobiales bacterium]|nr:GNAT family N-acetyltransferase [Hyphomicrobiales bacterium]MDE2114171.1 GNAT family N-acetyltransferase [Hyphomicrobiales bacterium]